MKMARLVVCLLLSSAALVHGGPEIYEGHQLYRIAGLGEDIRQLESQLDILSATAASRSASGKLEALVRLSPAETQQWLQYFELKGLAYTKVADNLAEILRVHDAQVQVSRAASKKSGRSMSWDSYYRHSEINAYLDNLAATYPNVLTVTNAGLSYEGRQIKVVKISTTGFENVQKPVIIIDAMVHAREWVTTPVALYLINQLVVDIVDSQLTEKVDWIIVPVANPDGYEYTFDVDRLWRKTRSLSHEGANECPGIDGNRNFDHHWGTTESAANPCAITYEGPTPFSEAEIRIIRDQVQQNIDRAALYISLHSYGNMFLYAWGNNGSLPSNSLDLHNAGVAMATAIDELSLEKADRYVVGNAANVLYFTTGTSRDWVRAAGVPLTYTLELPGYEYNFVVPPQYVEQIIKETFAGIAAGAHYVIEHYDYPSSAFSAQSSLVQVVFVMMLSYFVNL